MPITQLTYEQQKRSTEMSSFNSPLPHDPPEIGFLMGKAVSRTSSNSSSLSSDSIDYFSTSSDESEDEDEDEGFTNWRKRKICEKLDERDRHFEVEYLLRRKSLQLCRQSSYPKEMFWSSAMSNPLSTSSLRGDSKVEPTNSRTGVLNTDSVSKSIIQIGKQLRSNCDRILDRSVSFVIDSSLLYTIGEAVNHVTTNHPVEPCLEYEDHVLFLADFFEQTPSLAIVLSESSPHIASGGLDLTLFRALEFLELRKVPPRLVSGLNTLRTKLKRIKCSRNLDSIEDIFKVPFCAEILPSVAWPELKEIDVAFNRLTTVDSTSLACTPALETLNMSRNRISSIDPSFSRILQTLCVLNLNFNQLTAIPPTPPNLKVLLLSNNYIPTLFSRHTLPLSLEMLDLSQNVISDEREIDSLRNLGELKNLAFIGNPITYSEKYRKIVATHLSRAVVKNKTFLLDSKKLSNSEVRFALEAVKRSNTPINPPPFLLSKSKSTGSAPITAKDRFSDLRSLTQSIDSTSSSIRSACRKKAKIREVVILDSDEIPASNMVSIESQARSSFSTGSSSSSIEEVPIPKSEEVIKATGEALKSIREKYGEEYWLFRQGGQDVSNLLNIEHRPDSPTGKTEKTLNVSRSLPLMPKDASFYSALSEWELSTTTLAPPRESSPARDASDESIKPVDDTSNSSHSDGLVFYPCNSGPPSDSLCSSPEPEFEGFTDPTLRATYFRTFENGCPFQLVILENFLYHIDPEKENAILAKWDLKSLKSLKEEKRYEEAESVHFALSFDTLRKTLREKDFVMPLKDFSVFMEKVNVYLQARTLQEFGEGFQCIKCQWEFSRGMANTTVITGGKTPREVPICPNPACQSELLIPLEAVVDVPSPPGNWEPIKSSTPQPGLFGGKSLPTESGMLEPSCKTSSSCVGTPKASPSNRTNSNNSKKEPKSESDIETLSCDDSSSIEVLPKTTSSSGNDSGSDVAVVEEAVELDMPELTLATAKNLGIPMTDSTSSGSCTGSICTQYEKSIASPNPVAQNQPSPLSILQHSNSSPTLPLTQPFKYDFENFSQVDHRLVLHCDLNLFRHPDERLLALCKVMVMTRSDSFLCLVIFSNKKIYFSKVIGLENDKTESWLSNWKNFHLSRLSKLDVLIGRQGIGLDFSGKYFALIFRDSSRTSNFIEFFLGEICGELECPPLVQDFSQTQKALMSPTNPIGYFGILRHAYCGTGQGTDKSYAASAVVVTNEEVILVADLSWLVNRAAESVTAKHVRELAKLRQVESLESEVTFVRLVFQLESVMLKWEFAFETEREKKYF